MAVRSTHDHNGLEVELSRVNNSCPNTKIRGKADNDQALNAVRIKDFRQVSENQIRVVRKSAVRVDIQMGALKKRSTMSTTG